MSDRLSPLAGKPAPASILIDVPELLKAYQALHPDPAVASQRVAFGTSGHRGTSTERSFNEDHILAITQAICEYRAREGITGPLFLGADTHALSAPAQLTALEVLSAHGVTSLVASPGGFTPTPAVSHAILTYNHGRSAGLADGIVVTPSHNPPDSGGFKYNPTHGGPADTAATGWIEKRANALIEGALQDVRRSARPAPDTVRVHDYLHRYVEDLAQVIDFAAIRAAGVKLGIDPMGGAGVHYWGRIAERYGIALEVVSEVVDPQFAFMTCDWDGKIRMDPSSPYAMQRLLGLRGRFDIAAGCDTDHDRHGIVARTAGLLPSNHYLVVMIDYLFSQRPGWPAGAGVGKTVVSTSLIDRVTAAHGRPLREMPVGFKWFAPGLFASELGFAGEESAGAAFLRRDGRVWTTDKDGLAPALLAAEITARTGRDPAQYYQDIVARYGPYYADRIEGAASPEQKAKLNRLTRAQLPGDTLAGEPIVSVLERAPANAAPFGGIKVLSQSGWFAARPSGTESLYKIYAESFRSEAHLRELLEDARRIVDAAIAV